MQEEAAGEEAAARKSMVGSGDRSERIRTYNFPERQVTDHRIGLTLHKLEWILQGELDEIIDAFDYQRSGCEVRGIMKICQLEKKITEELCQAGIEANEAASMARILLAYKLSIGLSQLPLTPRR